MKLTDEQIVANMLRFNKELIESNIKYAEEIEELKEIIKEAREYIEKVETLAMVDKVNIFSMSTFKKILDKGSK